MNIIFLPHFCWTIVHIFVDIHKYAHNHLRAYDFVGSFSWLLFLAVILLASLFLSDTIIQWQIVDCFFSFRSRNLHRFYSQGICGRMNELFTSDTNKTKCFFLPHQFRFEKKTPLKCWFVHSRCVEKSNR